MADSRLSTTVVSNKPRSMDLPAELLEAICDHLSLNDVKNWSSVNRHFYWHLLPILHDKDAQGDGIAAAWACRKGFLNVLKRALVAGIDVNRGAFSFSTPQDIPGILFPMILDIATYYDNVEIIEFLILNGADTKIGRYPWRSAGDFLDPVAYARSARAVELLASKTDNDRSFLIAIHRMVEDYAPLPAIEAALDHIQYPDSLESKQAVAIIEDILVKASSRHRIDVLDLLSRRLNFGNESSPYMHYGYQYLVAQALLPESLPTNERIMHQTIGQILRLSNREPSTFINTRIPVGHGDRPWEDVSSLLIYSMHPWIPVSVTKRFLDLGADPHMRCEWPTFSTGYCFDDPLSLIPIGAPTILGMKWQYRGTALGFSLGVTFMGIARNYRQGNREKARLLLKYGAGFEAQGYPVSFILCTATWPYSNRKVMDHILRLFGEDAFDQRNKYGETHLSSLLSWMTNTGAVMGSRRIVTAMPIERWAWSIARLIHELLKIDRCKSHLMEKPTSGPSKGLLPIEIIARHKPSTRNFKPIENESFIEYYAVMDVLLEHGSNVNTKDSDGRSLLHWAAILGEATRVWYLIGRGANINDVDNNGFTPLHLACQIAVENPDWYEEVNQSSARVEIIRKLVWHGADINAKTNQGQTPLFVACQSLDCAIVAELLCLGADLVKDYNGQSPQDEVRRAEPKYEDFHLGAEGAIPYMLFEQGDVGYLYSPKESVLNLLNDPNASKGSRLPGGDTRPLSRRSLLEKLFQFYVYGILEGRWLGETPANIEEDCQRPFYGNDFLDWNSEPEDDHW